MTGYEVSVGTDLLPGLLNRQDGLAKLVEAVLNQVLEAQVTETLRATRHERTDERAGYRNGYPMGEWKRKHQKDKERLLSCTGLQTIGGRIQVCWATGSAATPMGQLAYFIEFLTLSGLWKRWVEGCPLNYTSGNASTKADILDTWLLSILSAHQRYAHVTAIRSDGVNPGLLGMDGVVSEDTLRRAL